jgi:hypothetical protein
MSGVISPCLVAMARVAVTGGGVPSYAFANGFETGTPEGATAGAAAIDNVAGDGNFILFLDEPVEYGSATQQGGLVALVISAESGVAVPEILFGTVGHGDTTGQDAAYTGVDDMKKIHVRFYLEDGTITNPTAFTILVFRNPLTLYP